MSFRTLGSRARIPFVAAVCLAPFIVTGSASADDIRVVIWDEQQPSQKEAYPQFLGEYIANYLKQQPGLDVRSVALADPEKGISDEILDNCDVLIWWGHVKNGDVSPKEAMKVVDRINSGKLSMIALHSAHWATPFVMAMHERQKQDAIGRLPKSDQANVRVEWLGDIKRRPPKRDESRSPMIVAIDKGKDGVTRLVMTRPNCCFPAYRNDGKPSTIKTLAPKHPIAKGIPASFKLPHTEMYDEPFHVPEPDEVIFEERWELGERFRSGAVWQVGKGKVFYFRPGHETHSVFTQPEPMQIVENAVRWLGNRKTFAPKQSRLPVAPPEDAIVLFDGQADHGFMSMSGEESNWPLEDGVLVSTRGKARTNHLVSRLHFRDADIHVEFQLPPKGSGNSGIYIHGNYELQILNSAGRENLRMEDMGALYGFAKPLANASRKPGEWQVYDIRYRAPRRSSDGQIVEEGTLTAWLNGVRVQNETRFGDPRSKYHPYRHGTTPYLREIWKQQKMTSVGPVFLQDHDNPVRFRNVWVRPLDKQSYVYSPKR